MTREEAIAILRNEKEYTPYYKRKVALGKAIKALEQQPCEECISRTELLSKIDAERKHLLDLKMDGAEHIIVHHARRIIEETPPVTPQPKIGRWMHPYKSDIACECSECHIQMPITKDFNYCPNCGAKMEVSE